jgi:hypothetical protein
MVVQGRSWRELAHPRSAGRGGTARGEWGRQKAEKKGSRASRNGRNHENHHRHLPIRQRFPDMEVFFPASVFVAGSKRDMACQIRAALVAFVFVFFFCLCLLVCLHLPSLLSLLPHPSFPFPPSAFTWVHHVPGGRVNAKRTREMRVAREGPPPWRGSSFHVLIFILLFFLFGNSNAHLCFNGVCSNFVANERYP